MNIKKLMKGLRSELDSVITSDISTNPLENKIITLTNLQEYKLFLKKIEFSTIHGPTILFTNGNGWYISTLIKNLLKSKLLNEPYKATMGVICSDTEAYQIALKENMDTFLADIPLLKVDQLTSVKQKEDYLRLVFVKIVLTYHALKLGYTVIYIDPDMAFKLPSLGYIIEKISENGLVLAGYKEGNMNTNVIGTIPTQNNIKLFEVDLFTFEANLLNMTKYNRFAGSDEEFLIMKDEYSPEEIHYLDVELFPTGKTTTNNKNIMMLHANCVQGLNNKVDFLNTFGGWFI